MVNHKLEGYLTYMEILPLLSTIMIATSATFVVIGWRLILKGEEKKHKKAMITAAYFARGFFALYISNTVFIGNTSFRGPDSVKIYYTIFLIFHIRLSGRGAVFGIVALRLGCMDSRAKHRIIGPLTSVIWLFSAITGFAVYIVLYLLFPGGETTGLIKAILGI